MTFFILLRERFTGLEAELNKLDAATGDGDHGTTVLKGLTAAADAPQGQVGKSFRTAAGGASGSLFGLVLGGIETCLAEDGDLATALDEAATKVNRLGQAVAGDKTMLDALIPAAQGAAGAESLADAARRAADSARAGAEATTPMRAKRGRARYVENAGEGHPDAGARSIAEILGALAEYLENRP